MIKNIILKDFNKTIGTKTKVHKVAFHAKPDLTLKDKSLLILDFEFSSKKTIYEIGGILIKNNVIQDHIFKEFSLPENELVFDFKLKKMIPNKINPGKKLFKHSKYKKEFMTLISSVDYIIVHNYVAEAGALFNLNYKNEKYDANKCNLLMNDKFICTLYSLKNKYFNLDIESFSNKNVSNYFHWNLIDLGTHIELKDDTSSFKLKKPDGIKSNLHNAWYDCVVTLSNFISIKRLKYETDNLSPFH